MKRKSEQFHQYEKKTKTNNQIPPPIIEHKNGLRQA